MPPCFLTKDTQCVLRNNSLVLGELWFLPTLLVLKVFSWNSVTWVSHEKECSTAISLQPCSQSGCDRAPGTQGGSLDSCFSIRQVSAAIGINSRGRLAEEKTLYPWPGTKIKTDMLQPGRDAVCWENFMLDRSHHALRSHCGHFQYVSVYSLWLLLYKMTSVCSPSARIPDGEAGVQRACCFLSVASTVTLPSLISAELRDLCSFKSQRKWDHRWTCWSACFRLCSFW